MDECGHRWDSRPGEAVGFHVCTKKTGHVDDPTDDDHRCCCGVNTWVTP